MTSFLQRIKYDVKHARSQSPGVQASEDDHFLRALTGMQELQEYFGLGVNFNGTIVHQHRIELFLLDPRGRVANAFARLQWDVREVRDSAKGLLPGR